MATWKSFFAFGVQENSPGFQASAESLYALVVTVMPRPGRLSVPRHAVLAENKRGGGPALPGIPEGPTRRPMRPRAYKSFDRYRPAALTQESLSATERLKTGFCGVPSLSAQK